MILRSRGRLSILRSEAERTFTGIDDNICITFFKYNGSLINMISSEREKLLSNYESLPEINRLILIIYSVLYREATQRIVIECLSSTDFRSLGHPIVYGKNFKDHLTVLTDFK